MHLTKNPNEGLLLNLGKLQSILYTVTGGKINSGIGKEKFLKNKRLTMNLIVLAYSKRYKS